MQRRAAERLEIDQPIANGQIVAVNKRVAEIAREIGVLEISFVVRAGSEQDDSRILAVGGRTLISASGESP